MHPEIAVSAVADQTKFASPSARSIRQHVDEILRFVDAQRMSRKYEPGWFEKVESELHRRVAGLERDLTAEIMEAHDVDAAAIEVEGQVHRRVLRAAQTYTTMAGEVVIERWLYRDRDDDTVECISVEGRARIAETSADADAIDRAVTTYVGKYWDDPTVHPEMEAFVRSNAIVEVDPDRAFGIIEREDEFARRATRWRW